MMILLSTPPQYALWATVRDQADAGIQIKERPGATVVTLPTGHNPEWGVGVGLSRRGLHLG